MARIDGDTLNNLIIGGMEDDLINGYGAIDLLRGGDGNDTVNGGDGPDSLYGDLGDDRIHGGGGDDLIRGGRGNDTVNGGDGNDMIRTDLGDDLIFASDGGDFIDGGPGTDTLDFGTMTEGAIVYSSGAVAYTLDRTSVMLGIEIYRGSAGDDSFVIDGEGKKLYGRDGDDFLYSDYDALLDGGPGDDTLQVFLANNANLYGKEGADTFSLVGWTSARSVTVTIHDFSQEDGDKLNLSNLRFGLSADDVQALLDGSEGNTLDLNHLVSSDSDVGTITLNGVNVADLTVDDFVIPG